MIEVDRYQLRNKCEYAKIELRAKLEILDLYPIVSIFVSYNSSSSSVPSISNISGEKAKNTTMVPPRFCSGGTRILFFAAIVGLVCANGVAMIEDEDFRGMSVELGKHQREFDYFALSMQWPPTYCKRTQHCCSSNACCRGANSPRIFTIHGLWPDYNDGTWPACCSGHNFDPKEIEPLKDALDQYWPTLSCSKTSNCHGGKGPFWGHEWEKHGTCSSPVLTNEYDYFLTTLNLYFKYNITSVLNDAGYVPSNTEKYPLGGIISAIENAYHVSPSVICSKDAVQEIRICFYKDFKPRDCVVDLKIDMVTSKDSCPKYVSLPEFGSYGNDEFQNLEFDGDEAAL